jgi:hypothetical protein
VSFGFWIALSGTDECTRIRDQWLRQRHSGAKEIKPEGYATTKLYLKKEGSATVQTVQAGA